jgi:hypothetical protein
MGIAVCGSGLGTVIFPLIMPYFINHPLWFDYDGGLLLEAAVISICVIFGILMVMFIFVLNVYNIFFFHLLLDSVTTRT